MVLRLNHSPTKHPTPFANDLIEKPNVTLDSGEPIKAARS